MQAYSLREKIAAIVKEARLGLDRAPATTFADRILAIPEIAEALRFVEGSPGFEPPGDTVEHVFTDCQFKFNPPLRDGETAEQRIGAMYRQMRAARPEPPSDTLSCSDRP